MRLLLISIFSISASMATTITNPSFGQTQTNCNYTSAAPYTTSTCPVIGNPLDFDVQSISVTFNGATVTATIDFNYGGGAGLAPFMDGKIQLQPGDLFFYDPSDPTRKLEYGVAIDATRPNSMYNFIAGDLYAIDNGISVETAKTALGNPDAYYRPTFQVLMVDNTSNPTHAAAGDGVTVTALGNGKTSAEYSATVQFTAPAGLLAMEQNGQIGVYFAAADCGNAYLEGVTPAAAPEPQDFTLMAIGCGLIGLASYWRKKQAVR